MIDDVPEIPGYTIEHLLGEGGMARVYLAIQRGFERPVALKIIAQELAASEEFGKRFLREARIVGMMSHQHIVPVYDVGEHDGVFYLAMEILAEGDLRSRMGHPMDEAVALRITSQLASALGYAHEKGFIHRDVKPDNVLFRDAETAVLTDFGIARTAEDSEDMTQITRVQSVIGSPKYMSPEQSLGHPLDARTDIYSLGIILFQMLTGDVPYAGRNVTEISLQRFEQQVPQLPSHLKHLQNLIDRLVAYQREERFSSCKEVLAALAAAAEKLTEVASAAESDATAVREMPAGENEQSALTKSPSRWLRPFPALAAALVIASLVAGVWYVQRDAGAQKLELAPVAQPQDAVDAPVAVVPAAIAETVALAPEPPSLPEIETKVPTPSPPEFFAFYDAVTADVSTAEESFLSAYPRSIFADILQAKLAGDSAYLERLKLQASAGSARAQLVLSELYDTGWGVPQDKKAALEYAKSAAAADSSFGLYQHATMLLARAKTDAERRAGLHILEKSAKQGFYLAQTVLANYLFEGRLLGRDIEESLRLLESASEQGDRNALFNLGRIYDGGINLGGPDIARAKTYFLKAAQLGHPKAQSYLQEPYDLP